MLNATPMPERRPHGQPSMRRITLAAFGFAIAIAAAFSSYDRKPSIWLSLLALMLVADTLGRRLADLLEQPRTLQRLISIALLPAASAGAISREELPPGRLRWELRRGQPHDPELTGKGWRHVHH